MQSSALERRVAAAVSLLIVAGLAGCLAKEEGALTMHLSYLAENDVILVNLSGIPSGVNHVAPIHWYDEPVSNFTAGVAYIAAYAFGEFVPAAENMVPVRGYPSVTFTAPGQPPMAFDRETQAFWEMQFSWASEPVKQWPSTNHKGEIS